jgi:hypothetical protein
MKCKANGLSRAFCGKGRDSSVGIATRYELDGPGIESRWGRDFSQPSRPALGPTQPSIHRYRVSFLGVKRPGRGVVHPPPSSARVKERVELYLYFPSRPSWSVIGRALPLPSRSAYSPKSRHAGYPPVARFTTALLLFQSLAMSHLESVKGCAAGS